MEPLRRTRLQATGLLAITFVVGALVGATSERALKARAPGDKVEAATKANRPDNDRGRTSGRRPSILLDPLVLNQIGATAEQRTKISAILARRDSASRKLWESIEPSMDHLMEETRKELRSQLDADQLAKLDQIIAERRARMREQRDSKSKLDTTNKKPENRP
jgi:hypothetical protein